MTVADQSAAASNMPRPGALAVRLSAQFVSRLCARIQKAADDGFEIRGLLFGAEGDGLIIVQAFKSVAVPGGESGAPLRGDRLERLILAAQTDPEVSALDLIGWYCMRASGGLHASEVEFHNAYFPHANDLALILKRETNSNLVLEFYSRANGAPLSSEAHRWGGVRLSTETTAAGPVEISMVTMFDTMANPMFEPTVLGSASRSIAPERRTRSQGESAVQRINAGQLPGLPAIRSQPKRRLPWVSSAIVCGVVAALTFVFLLLHGLSSEGALPPFLRAILPDTGLMLRAEGQGDRVLLSWNRRNAVVRSASGGVLHIDDGSQHRDVHLDSGQVENGLVLYRPGSNDVTFRLEIRGQQGSQLTESVRVLDGAQSAPLELNGNTESNTASGADVAARAPERRRPDALGTQNVRTRAIGTTEQAALPASSARASSTGSSPRRPALRAREPNASAESEIAPPILVGTNRDTSNPTETDLAAGPGATDTEGSSATAPAALTAGGSKNASTGSSGQNESPSSIENSGRSPRIQAPAGRVRPPLGTPQNNQPLAGLIPATPIRQVLPDTTLVSPAVLASHPQIDIVVQVDTRGKVTDARFVGGKKVPQSLIGAALFAAKQWIFKPATLGGHSIESEHTILFQFRPPDQKTR